MTNKDKYVEAFKSSFETDQNVEHLKYGESPEWDSIGHMCLISALEDIFEIEFEPEDILNFKSYDDGIALLKSKGIEI